MCKLPGNIFFRCVSERSSWKLKSTDIRVSRFDIKLILPHISELSRYTDKDQVVGWSLHPRTSTPETAKEGTLISSVMDSNGDLVSPVISENLVRCWI